MRNHNSWWRHQMETFSALLAFCVGNSPVTGEFPSQRPVTRSFDVFFDLRLNKRLSKQSWGWWFETPSRSLWHHCNEWLDVEQAATHYLNQWWPSLMACICVNGPRWSNARVPMWWLKNVPKAIWRRFVRRCLSYLSFIGLPHTDVNSSRIPICYPAGTPFTNRE